MPTPTEQINISVDFDGHGGWRVELDEDRIPCETLQDARRIARQRAGGRSCGELVVRDAYHRVIERERLTGTSPERRLSGRSVTRSGDHGG